MDVQTQPVRSRAIDALRALAVLLVIGRHVGLVTEEPPEAFSPWLQVWIRGGWVGVDLFFVLSGYLVSGLIFREHGRTGGFRPLHFLGRRGFKLYPGFWLLIAATCGLLAGLGQKVTASRGALLLGVVLGELVEVPALRLRDRWLPSRSGALVPAGR